MSFEKRFSIVAPNWNEMPHFENFLESLRRQDFKDFEVIIVDGKSTDDSCLVAHKYFEDLDMTWIEDETHNIGYIRNVGSMEAKGRIIIQTSGDCVFPLDLLSSLDKQFREDENALSIAGRAIPIGDIDWVGRLAYWGFDTMRWFFTHPWLPKRYRKFRPAGNFLAIYNDFFWSLDGYPEVKINEDGLLGYKIDDAIRDNDYTATFKRNLHVSHHVKRFADGVKGVIFYIYVLGLFFPWLNPFLKRFEERSAETFSTRSDLE